MENENVRPLAAKERGVNQEVLACVFAKKPAMFLERVERGGNLAHKTGKTCIKIDVFKKKDTHYLREKKGKSGGGKRKGGAHASIGKKPSPHQQ